jgi:hypothetical protein
MLHLYVVRGRLNGIGCGEQLLSMQVSVKGSDFVCALGECIGRGMGLKPTLAIRTTFQWEVDTSN